MTVSLNAQGLGVSGISPDLTNSFLSFNIQNINYSSNSIDQHLTSWEELINHFDLLTSCNLRDYNCVARFLNKNKQNLIQNELTESIYQALSSWSALNFTNARDKLITHISRYPQDIIAIFMVHMLDFCTGRTADFLSYIDKRDNEIAENNPFLGYYLGVKSFVCCEAGHYEQSLEIGLEVFQRTKYNIYAIHAVAHAYHERKEYKKIIDFLTDNIAYWINNPGMRMHVCWHLAVAEMSIGSFDKAEAEFDSFYSMKTAPCAEEDLDAVNFLWRYRLCVSDNDKYQDIWSRLADSWTGCIGASISFFHDLHAALAFASVSKPYLIEKLTSVGVLGIIACLAGSAIIILNKDPSAIQSGLTTWKGDLLIFGCVGSWVVYTVFSRPLTQRIGAITVSFYSIVAGAFMLFVAALVHGDLTTDNILRITFDYWFNLAFLGILGSALAYVWYYQEIEKIGATQAGVYIALVLFSAVLLGFVLLNESLSFAMIVGGLTVVTGIILCNSSKKLNQST
jgi:uncharacterized membrane protein